MSRGILKSGRKRQISCSKDAIEVFCRVRPINENEETCAEMLGETQIQLNAPKDTKNSSKVEQVTCTFNKVFTEDESQSQIYEQVGIPLVKDFLQGKNGLCFMYGITGSGKTHTMNGHSEDGGVLPRCLDSIFNSINDLQTPRCTFKPNGYNGFDIKNEEDAFAEAEKKCQEMDNLMKNIDMSDMQRVPDDTKLVVEEDNNYAVFISFVEVYNNSVFDLLELETFNALKQAKPPVSKILREDPRRNMFVHDVNEIEVKDANEAYTLFLMGQNKRKTALTLMNAESSRSHCVFTIKLVQAPLNPRGDAVITDPTMICISQLSLCDLAGSERISRTKTEGERIKQAGHINNSLMTLRSCLECLRENQKNGGSNKVVPYRDSKITHLFKNYFDGDGKVNMIVCLNPRNEDFDESLHVMRFAEMTQEVKVARSEVHKFDTGLTAGRGKASKLFKLMSSEESGSDTGCESMAPPALQLFQPWPPHHLAGCNDTETLVNLMKYLEDRWKLRTTLLNDWKEKSVEVRRMIVQLEEDNGDLTKALEEQRSLLSEKEKETRTYEKRIRSLNERYDNLQRSSQSFESQKRQFAADLEKQKELTAKEKQEKLKLKQTLKDLTSTERLRWEKVCDRKVQDKQKEMEEQVLRRNEKLNQLRSVLDNLQIPAENQRRLTQIINDEKMPVCNNQAGKENKCCCNMVKETSQLEKICSCSEPTVKNVVSKPKKTPRAPHSTRNLKVESLSTPRKPSKVRSKSPPPLSAFRRNDVAPVRGKHRRSRSTDFYLNHKPADTLHTDTMMKPVLKNKKTVATPSAKDLKVVPGYVLTHQEEDSSGEICTKLIRGDVLPTRSGGAAVQFTDVEVLTNNHDPAGSKSVASKAAKYEKKVQKHNRDSNKRHAEDDSVDSQDSWTDVETRCAIGIEGKPGADPGIMHHSKKPKH